MEPKKTGLYDIHVSLGGKMVEFAGFLMPTQYTSMIEEHKKVRQSVGVFDVSHMGEVEVRGPKALEFVNYITINNAAKLELDQAQYTAMCYPDGGIVDDLICYRMKDHYLLVINASNTQKDYDWIQKQQQNFDGVETKNISDSITQLAVQGKNAEAALQKLTKVDLSEIKFYWFREGELGGVPMIISRTGYTGEPGFELYFDKKYSTEIWNKVFEAGREFDIAPIGLGARDTLRLEKKYCLYGNDIDQTTNPLEAGLGWITKLAKGDFVGRDALLKVKEEGLKRKLMGFVVEGKMIPRHGYPIEIDGKQIGVVTSGCYSPILNQNIGLGYVATEYAEIGQELTINGRGRLLPATIVKMPFVE
ncbi:MAG: glycine cleavage system aminomethyltransferase GcvT [Calditrichia bacterium]